MLTRSHLRDHLKKLKLPHTDMTLNRFERDGIIPIPRRMRIGKRKWRMYSEEEISDIIEKIKQYKLAL